LNLKTKNAKITLDNYVSVAFSFTIGLNNKRNKKQNNLTKKV